MTDALFYHLQERPLDARLPAVVEKAVARGWQVELRAATPATADMLDLLLWTYRDESFLPHGKSGTVHDAMQPVLITLPEARPTQRACLITVEAAALRPEDWADAERICVMFESADQAQLEAARSQWRLLTGAGLAAQYWRDEPEGWKKIHEAKAT